MKTFHKILALCFGALSLASCSGKITESEQIFMDMTEKKGVKQICLLKDGKILDGLKYDENTCQLGYNPSTKTFKMIKDDGSYYYMVTIEEPLKEGKKAKVTVKYTTKNDVVTVSGGKFHVVDIDPASGITRLWNESAGIGVSIVDVN